MGLCPDYPLSTERAEGPLPHSDGSCSMQRSGGPEDPGGSGGGASREQRSGCSLAETGGECQRDSTQALCWLLDAVLDAEDDLLALAARPGASCSARDG
jgi:hypothetical protein